jgi:hypothetical protein
MRDKERIMFVQQTNKIDYSTGEVMEQEVYINKVIDTEPSYVKLYLDVIATFKQYSKAFSPILLGFLEYMSYANKQQIIFVNKPLKEKIANKCNVSLSRVEHALTEFVDVGIFFRVKRGEYHVNAEIFGKGDWRDIKKIRGIQAAMDMKNRRIMSNIIFDD